MGGGNNLRPCCLQVIGFAQRTPAPPEPAGAPTPGIARLFANTSAPSPFNVREAVLDVVASVREASAAATASDAAARPTKAGRAQQAVALRAQAPSGSGTGADAPPASPSRKRSTAASAAAGVPPTPNARSGTGGGGASSGGGAVPGTATPGVAEALKAPQPVWHSQLAPLACADVAQLVATAGSLYDVLLSHR